MKNRHLGAVILGISIILFLLLGYYQNTIAETNAKLCEISCAAEGNDYCPADHGQTSFSLYGAFIVIIFLVGLSVYLIFWDKDNNEFKKVNLSKLDVKEKEIYHIIKNNDGSMYQSDLIKETGFSKVKITRILDKLEQKGIVEKKRRGMTNIVVLK